MNHVETEWFLAEGGCDGGDIEIFVRGTVTPRVPATFDSPAEGGEVHIDAIEVSLPGGGRMVWSGELTEAERESVEEAMRVAAFGPLRGHCEGVAARGHFDGKGRG